MDLFHYLLFWICVIGLCLGSFFNVVILRSLNNESISQKYRNFNHRHKNSPELFIWCVYAGYHAKMNLQILINSNIAEFNSENKNIYKNMNF